MIYLSYKKNYYTGRKKGKINKKMKRLVYDIYGLIRMLSNWSYGLIRLDGPINSNSKQKDSTFWKHITRVSVLKLG